ILVILIDARPLYRLLGALLSTLRSRLRHCSFRSSLAGSSASSAATARALWGRLFVLAGLRGSGLPHGDFLFAGFCNAGSRLASAAPAAVAPSRMPPFSARLLF